MAHPGGAGGRPVQLLVILFHKKIHSIYPDKWIRKCLLSMVGQTFTAFDIFECAYDTAKEPSVRRLIQSDLATSPWKHEWIYTHHPCVNHADAMNVCIDYAASHISSTGHPYLAIANVNLDDYYHHERLEKQWNALINGADLISSFFYHVMDCPPSPDSPTCHDQVVYKVNPDIGSRHELVERMKDENVIAHPVVMMNLSVWRKHPRLYYQPNELPREDYLLWQRMLEHPDIHVVILPEYLLYYRRHRQQISRPLLPVVTDPSFPS